MALNNRPLRTPAVFSCLPKVEIFEVVVRIKPNLLYPPIKTVVNTIKIKSKNVSEAIWVIVGANENAILPK